MKIKIPWFWLSLLLMLVFFHTRGMVPYDEGWFVTAAARVAKGVKIYRDFLFIYNPGVVWIDSLAMMLLGKSVLATRAAALFNSMISLLLIHLISRKLRLSGISEILGAGIYVFWGPGMINFGWPVMWCIAAALGWVFLTADKRYFWAGAAAAAVFVFKQNFGAAMVPAAILVYLADNKLRDRITLSRTVAGYLAVMGVFAAYLAAAGILGDYLYQLKYYTLDRIFLSGALASPWPWEYPLPIYIKAVKTILYLLPAGSAGWLLVRARTTEDRLLPAVLAAFWALSIRPTTDILHLSPLLALTGVTLAAGMKRAEGKKGMAAAAIPVIIMTAGMYRSVWGNYYRWNTPLIQQNTLAANPRMRVFTDRKSAENINNLTKYFDDHLKDERQMFVYSYSPLWYMVLDKENPTRYDYLHSGVIRPEDEIQVIFDLERSGNSIVLTDHNITSEESVIARYIEVKYRPVFKSGDYEVWQKNPDFFAYYEEGKNKLQ